MNQRFDVHEARYVRLAPSAREQCIVCVGRDTRGDLLKARERVHMAMDCAGDTEPAKKARSSRMDVEEQIEEHLISVFDVLPKKENTTAFWEWIVQKRAGPWLKHEEMDT